jgi:ribosome-associated toxin RatA of RatAB toxin-antitoxin module
MWFHRWWFRLSLVTLSFWFCPSGAAEVEVNWKALFDGKVLVEAVDNDEGIPGLKALFTVSASNERIWAVLLDYDNFPKIFKGIMDMRVIWEKPSGALIEFKIDAVLKNYKYTLYRHYEKKNIRITWRRVSGDMKRIEGSWQILDTPHHGIKLLIYESFVKVGGIIPTRLVRWGAKGKAREMGVRLRNWIEGQPLEK